MNDCEKIGSTASLLAGGTISGSLTVTGDLTVEGNFNFGDAAVDTLTATGDINLLDDVKLEFGTGLDSAFVWNTAQTVDALFLGLATAQNTFVIAELGDIAFNFAHAAQTNPTIFLHSANQSTTQWLSLAHNQTNGVISTGTGRLVLNAASHTVLLDNKLLLFGTGDDTGFMFNTVQTNDSLWLGLDAVSRSMVIGEAGDQGFDFAHAAQTNPTVFLHSAAQNTTQWLSLTHNQTDSVLTTGTGGFQFIQTAGTVGATGFTFNVGAHTAITASTEQQGFDFAAVTKTWAAGALTTQREVLFRAPTYAFDGASTITNAGTVVITGAPIAGTNATITNAYSLWSQSGTVRFNSATMGLVVESSDAGGGATVKFRNSAVAGFTSFDLYNSGDSKKASIAWSNASAGLFPGSFWLGHRESGGTTRLVAINTSIAEYNSSGNFSFTPVAASSGAQTYWKLTAPASTGQTAATEIVGVDFDMDATKTWASGAGPLATQREVLFRAPTYVGDAAGALTVTRADTVSISGAPIAGANMTLTQANALYVGGQVRFDDQLLFGSGVATTANQYSVGRNADATNRLQLNAPTSALIEFSINDVAKAAINNSGLLADFVFNLSSGSNAKANFATTGTTISRNIADANTALIIDQVHASSTGNILDLHKSSVLQTHFSSTGQLVFDAGSAVTGTVYSIGRNADATNLLQYNVPTGGAHEFSINDLRVGIVNSNGLSVNLVSNLTSIANSRLGLLTTGSHFVRDIADANPALIVQQLNAGSTGNILDLKNNVGTLVAVTQKGLITQSVAITSGETAFTGTYSTSGAVGTITGQALTLNAGYTGSNITQALSFDNVVAGLNATYQTDGTYGSRPGGNRGAGGYSRATTSGVNTGLLGLARGGIQNWGGWLGATDAEANKSNIGVIGLALNDAAGGEGIGVYALYDNPATVPNIGADTKTAFLADNGANAVDIAIFRDNAVDVWKLIDGGSWQIGKTIEGLIEHAAQTSDVATNELILAAQDAFQSVAALTNADGGNLVLEAGSANLLDTAAGGGGNIILSPGKRGQFGDGAIVFYDNKTDQTFYGSFRYDQSTTDWFHDLSFQGLSGETRAESIGYSSMGTFYRSFRALNVASSVNYVQVTGAATGGNVLLGATGSDTDIQLNLTSKGTDGIFFGNSTNIGILSHTGLAIDKAATFTLSQGIETSDVAVTDMTISAQSAFATAVTNVNGADLIFEAGNSATASGEGGDVVINLATGGGGQNGSFLINSSGGNPMFQIFDGGFIFSNNQFGGRLQSLSDASTIGATTDTITVTPMGTDNDSTIVVKGTVVAISSDGAKAAAFTIEAVYRNDGGVLTEVADNTAVLYRDDAVHNATIAASGTDIIITVTGDTGDTMTWSSDIQTTTVAL